jgi:hypothetical protein
MSNDVTVNDAPQVGPNDQSSAAATPQKRKVSDFFKIVPSSEHIKQIDEMMAPDSMDLRNVFKSGQLLKTVWFSHSPLSAVGDATIAVSSVGGNSGSILNSPARSRKQDHPRRGRSSVRHNYDDGADATIEEEVKVDEENEVELEEEEDEEADAAIEGQEEENDGNCKSLIYSTLTADDFPSFRSFL